jgi:hypothetical protein
MWQDWRFIGGDEIMFYFHGQEDKNFCLEHPEKQAESTGITVTSLCFEPMSNLILKNNSKQIPKFSRRENPKTKEFQENKSYSCNSSNNLSASFVRTNLT